MITCPDCGAENSDDAQWCTRCQYRFSPRRASAHVQSPGGTSAAAAVAQAQDPEEQGEAVTAVAEAEVTELPLGGEATSAQVPSQQQDWGGEGEYGRGTIRPTALFPQGSHSPVEDANWVAKPQEYGLTLDEEMLRIGPTAFRFTILGALILLIGAALPTIVFSIVNDDGTTITRLVYLPLDIAVCLGCAILAPLGRRRTWTGIRLTIVGTVLATMVAYRYLTFRSVSVGFDVAGAQSLRLGPGWYMMVLGAIALFFAWINVIRGRF